jgi:uncharacterized membrane protein (UPF0127 family)
MNVPPRLTALPLTVLSLALLGARGCDSGSTTAPSTRPVSMITLKLGDRQYKLEVANDDKTRQKGLMHRDSMPADHGMLFVFPQEQMLGFWMKGTRIPLDIIYLDAKGTIVAVKPMHAYDLTSVSSDRPAKFAIELNQGQAAAAGVKVGDVIEIPTQVAQTDR